MVEPCYGPDLALVHHRGFGLHADRCAEGILGMLEPLGLRHGVVLELGCGTGRLTRHLVDAGHRVIATDASPAMLDLAREAVPEAQEIRLLALPDDPLPPADAVVSVGHVLNYLPDEASIERALLAIAGAVRPGGVLALDLCDLRWGAARRDQPSHATVEDDWAVFSASSLPEPTRYVRDITTFVRRDDGTWRRADERHVNVLVDATGVPALLARRGVEATVEPAFGSYVLPEGLRAVTGRRAGGTRDRRSPS